MTAATDTAEAPIAIPSAWEIPWTPLDTARDGNVPGPVWKVLRLDPATSATTYLMHLPPGWRDTHLDWHPTTEESFKLCGLTQMPGNSLHKGTYMYRPPGILHGPPSCPSDDGATILQRTSGELRILRYDGRAFPQEHLQPITDDYKDWPVEWNEHLDTEELPWDPVSTGGWSGAAMKWLHRNRQTGGGCVLLQLPAGWRGSGSPGRGPIEEFVVSGTLTVGDEEYGKWGYRFRPVGSSTPAEYSSSSGATLLCWWDQASEL